jgi:hypothetical protein
MRTFNDIRGELNLEKFVGSFNGDLFCVPVAPGALRILVRHFNRDLPAELIPAYAALLRAAEAWIEGDPELASVVRVDQPTEVGEDFIARLHRMGTSLSAYSDDDPADPPEELRVMQSRFRARLTESVGPEEALIARVLARSILEPTGKTIYSFPEAKFIIADLKPTLEELDQYRAARTPRSEIGGGGGGQ